MPYAIDSPPEAIKGLPRHAQEIFIAAFNSAFEQYGEDEARVNAVAWAALKTKFEKNAQGEWVAKESALSQFQKQYGEIILETGRKNVSGERINKLTEGYLKVNEAPEEMDEAQFKAFYQLTKDAADTETWLKEQVATKAEDGVNYPAAAYAYVPDAEKPGTWKLRLWEDAEKKVTRAQLGKAAAALSPGGFRGQKAEIPAEELPAVKRKIRAEYRKQDVEDSDMPKWVQEVTMNRVLISDYLPLTEANIGSKGSAQIVVIKPGLNASKERYYPAEMLARDYKVFEGVKMFADHPSEADEKNRPERSVRDWVATLKNVHVGDDGAVLGEAVVVEPWLQERLATLRDKNMLGEMGVSINAIGSGSKGEVDGAKTNIIEKIVRARSVDFVTEAGAGGGVTLYEAGSLDVDLIGMDVLREHRPELVKEIENKAREDLTKEVKKMPELEEKIKTLESQITTLSAERDGLKAKITEAERLQAVAETKAKLDEALSKSDLPAPAKARIMAQFKEATSDTGIADAIKAEGEYIASITESGKVKGMGGGPAPKAVTVEELRKSWKTLRPDFTDAQIDAAIAGR